jgi:hypothetical protein
MRAPLILLATLFTLPACTREAADAGAAGMTEGENAAIAEAAERLDARPPAPGAEGAKTLESDIRDQMADEERVNQPN